MQPLLNIKDIERTYELIAHENETEIRLLDPHRKQVPKSKWVSSKEEFVRICTEANGFWNVYVGINERKHEGTNKEDVLSVKTLVIDIDPARETNTAATNKELELAKEVAFNIEQDFVNMGFVRPSKGMSGNGVQLWFAFPKIDLTDENRTEIEDKVKKFIYNIQKKYNTKEVKIDQIGDLPRIIKVMGTKSIKGEPSEERPHRVSEWYYFEGRQEDLKFKEELLKLEPIKDTETICVLDEKKESRSEIEFGAVCKYLKQGLTKEDIFRKMMAYAKWANPHHPSYREHTYKKAEQGIKLEMTTIGKVQLTLPHEGKLISEFAEEVSNVVKDKMDLFYRVDTKEIVEIGKIIPIGKEEEISTGFISVKSNSFITLIERYIVPGYITKDKETEEIRFKQKSMTSELAGTLLASSILQKSLPQIQRIFTIPLPIMHEEEITFPCKGYDRRFGSWTPSDAPDIVNPEMTLQEAKEVLKDIYEEFCFKTDQDYYNAIAALLTPYLRGLFTSFNVRTPVYFYIANRERAGKDYLAGVTGIVHEGYSIEEAPISNGDKYGGNTSEELRKKVLAALIRGRKRMHFSNNKGHIDNATFESIATATKYSDRILGRTENVELDNELDLSLSGNIGVTFTPDFANRCRFIRLFLDIENANDRKFKKTNLHYYVLQNRGRIISALYALVRNWKDKGMPEGTVNFASFPEWAKICGGIMESSGYGNPCVQDKAVVLVEGDNETQDMKILFEKVFEKHPGTLVMKLAILDIIEYEDLFSYWDLKNNRGDQTKFGNLLNKYVGRALSDIHLVDTTPKERPSRKQYRFTKEEVEKTLINF
jgi:hypothetical protein